MIETKRRGWTLSASIGLCAIALSACTLTPQEYETPPVKVETATGTVTCQLYTRQRVLWDRAIDWPRSMNHETADNVCIAEGYRQLSAS